MWSGRRQRMRGLARLKEVSHQHKADARRQAFRWVAGCQRSVELRVPTCTAAMANPLASPNEAVTSTEGGAGGYWRLGCSETLQCLHGLCLLSLCRYGSYLIRCGERHLQDLSKVLEPIDHLTIEL
jgi:hypothetical protein